MIDRARVLGSVLYTCQILPFYTALVFQEDRAMEDEEYGVLKVIQPRHWFPSGDCLEKVEKVDRRSSASNKMLEANK